MKKLFSFLLIGFVFNIFFVFSDSQGLIYVDNLNSYVGFYKNVINSKAYLDENGRLKFVSFTSYLTYNNGDLVDPEVLDKRYDLGKQALLRHGTKYYLTKNSYQIEDVFDNSEFSKLSRDLNVHKYLYQDSNYGSFDKNEILDILGSIELLTNQITNKAESDDEKIFGIYKRLVYNVSYHNGTYLNLSKGLDPPSGYWDSGLGTYKNKQGVCNGFIILMYYMLKFAGIDSQIFNGNLFLVDLNKNVFHSWIKIGNYYYDPTLDSKNSINQWKRYKLPKAVMYANRSEENVLYVTKSVLDRKYCDLAQRYYKYDYNLLEPYNSYHKKGIECEETLDIELLKKFVKKYINANSNFEFIENGSKKKLILDGYRKLNNDISWYFQNLDIENQVLFKIGISYYISLNGYEVDDYQNYEEKLYLKDKSNYKVSDKKSGNANKQDDVDTQKYLDSYEKMQQTYFDDRKYNNKINSVDLDFDKDLSLLTTQLELYLKLKQYGLLYGKLNEIMDEIEGEYGISKYADIIDKKIEKIKINRKLVQVRILKKLEVENNKTKKGIFLYIYFALY